MNIKEVKNTDLELAVTLTYDPSSPCRIKRNWNSFYSRQNGIVYFIVIDGDIVKIGGSSQDIHKLIAQYLVNLESKAEPRENRFCIHLKMLDSLYKGHMVQFYIIPSTPQVVTYESLTGEMKKTTINEFRLLESSLINDYREINGSVPSWNNSEGKIGWPEDLIALFDRREKSMKNGESVWWNYQTYWLDRAGRV